MMKKTNLYIDGTNLFAGQNDLFGPRRILDFNYLTSGKEKGVDVHLAVDIVKDALLGNCLEAVIMTGDADLVYPMKIANDFGVYTKAIFLPNRFSAGIAHEVKKAYILNFKHNFKKNKKDPSHLTIVPIKNPRFIKKRGR